MTTAFLPDGELDLPGCAQLTRHLIAGGVEFLVVLGTTGEAATVSASEQERVVDAIVEANNGEVPLVLGIGGNFTLAVAEKQMDWTRKYKPDALLSVSPYYSKPSQEGIFRHFSYLAERSDVPIILYNVPSRTGSNMTSATTLRLAHAFPNIIGIKEASGNIEQVMEIIRDRPEGFLVLSGDDAITLPLIAAGADGVISVVANALPRQFSQMVRDALAQDFAAARDSHYAMLRLMQLLFAEGNPVGVKAALEILGIGGSFVRMPLFPATDGLCELLGNELMRMGAIGTMEGK
ncbi:MAG: hypothetical protein RLZZ165_2108 [Bacteroidota bacterium]